MRSQLIKGGLFPRNGENERLPKGEPFGNEHFGKSGVSANKGGLFPLISPDEVANFENWFENKF